MERKEVPSIQPRTSKVIIRIAEGMLIFEALFAIIVDYSGVTALLIVAKVFNWYSLTEDIFLSAVIVYAIAIPLAIQSTRWLIKRRRRAIIGVIPPVLVVTAYWLGEIGTGFALWGAARFMVPYAAWSVFLLFPSMVLLVLWRKNEFRIGSMST